MGKARHTPLLERACRYW